MEYAQYTIICGSSEAFVEQSLERIAKVQAFQQQYQILEMVEDGLQAIHAFQAQHPGFSLDLAQCPQSSHFVHVLDWGQFHPRTIRLERHWKVFLRGLYYYTLAQNPHLEATRNGQVAIFECDGMGYHNFCLDFERRVGYELRDTLPFRFQEVSFVHTPLVATVFHGLMKKIWDDNFLSVVHLGGAFGGGEYDGRRDALFLHPTLQVANQRQLDAAARFLQTWFQNKRTFRL